MRGQAEFEGMDRAKMLKEEMARRAKELSDWWMDIAQQEAEQVIPKAVEYGASDLRVMGAAMRHLFPGEEPVPERVLVEMAIAFYALGKVARLFGAYEQGRLPSDDTWHDLGVYCRMAQHVRAYGEWV